MRTIRTIPVLACLALVASCATPLTTEEIGEILTKLEKPSRPSVERRQATVQIQSDWLSGEFQGVSLARRDPFGVRVQLFPDIGGKVLDAIVNGQRRWTRMTFSEQDPGQRSEAANDHPLFTMFGCSIAWLHSAVGSGDVLSGFRVDEGTATLRMKRRFDTECELSLSTDGTKRFDVVGPSAWMQWVITEKPGGEVEVTGKGFSLTVTPTGPPEPAEATDAIFAIPGGN